MHPMPREGTETIINAYRYDESKMHPMPREGTETCKVYRKSRSHPNASYAP